MMDEQTLVEAPETTPEQARYEAYKQEHDALAQRLAQLEGLTLAEVTEQQALERLLANRLPTLERLQHDATYAIAQIDAVAVKAAHDRHIPAKQMAYARIAAAVAEVHAAFRDLQDLHDTQVAPLEALRQPVTNQPAVPVRSGWEVAQDVASRMPAAMGWTQVLFQPTSGPLTQGDLDQMMDADPGLRELNPRILERYLAGLRA
jgi:hypothetical protein